AFRAHSGEHGADREQFLQVHVGRHHAGAAAVGLEGMPSRAAPEVEHAVAGLDGKLREVDGQQPGSPLITFWYSASVAAATAGHANRSRTRSRPAAVSRALADSSSSTAPSVADSSSASP